MGVNEVDEMTDMGCVIECEMDECVSRGGVGGQAGVCFVVCVLWGESAVL